MGIDEELGRLLRPAPQHTPIDEVFHGFATDALINWGLRGITAGAFARKEARINTGNCWPGAKVPGRSSDNSDLVDEVYIMFGDEKYPPSYREIMVAEYITGRENTIEQNAMEIKLSSTTYHRHLHKLIDIVSQHIQAAQSERLLLGL